MIPRAIDAALGRDAFTVFGDDYDTPDGTCLRDYVHVTDLAAAHLLALDALRAGAASTAYNLGNGTADLGARGARRGRARDRPPGAVRRRRRAAPAIRPRSSRRASGPGPSSAGRRGSRTSTRSSETAWRWREPHPHGYGDRTAG